MESRATTAESKHTYPTSPWIHPSAITSTSATLTPCHFDASSRVPAQLDFWPFLFPQQASVYQAQLLHYTNLVSPGRGGGLQQAQPLPQATVATPHIQAAPRSRSSSKVSNKDSVATKGTQGGHGNRAAQNKDKGDRAVVTGKDAPPKMELSHPLPARPAARATNGQSHSNSMPSTPQQHARNFSFESREPSPTATNNHSPRSAYSETNSNLPSLRPLPPRLGGCRFETAQVNSRRRMPYNLGSDKLERISPDKIKSKLSEDQEKKLTADMRELYDRLIPTPKVEENRKKLVVKLERIFNEEWPGNDIRVHLFGSSGNLLCSDDSDVDICITTAWKEMEGVCMIANLLAKKGMEKVVCISAAKVPIVKIWDPELGLACDMNVNNTLALENTRMVRTYVEIDPRVRPMAMIIKYWTRKRIVNDAAFGGTLSSYTWICLIIGFLQLRDPPVLPSLHQRQHQRLPWNGGPESAFADDLDKLRGFGDKNKSSLGELLFQFFKFYAHEFDYEKHAISIRLGRRLSKQEKGWHIGLNNHLCVEEPFNTIRNLGNTADEYSFRGLHLELRRAFDLISEGKLDECCEQYVYPKEEPPTFQRPAQTSRPVMIRSSSQQHSGRGGRGNYRGGRHSNNFHRNGGNSNRRASSSVAYDTTNTMYMQPVAMSPQELAWFTQQAQSHSQVHHPAALVSAAMAAQLQQENNLRQYYSQTQVFQQQVQAQAQMAAQMHAQRMQSASAASQQGSERPRTNSFDNPPLSAPIATPDWYSMYGMPFPAATAYYGQPGFAYPSSPATTAATPEYRRGLQRSSVTTESGTSTSGSSLRSQSQPASRSAPTAQQAQGYPGSSTPTNGSNPVRQVNGVTIPSFVPDDVGYEEALQRPASGSPASDEGSSYLGYYVSEASSPARPQGGVNAVAFGDVSQPSQGRRRPSTDVPQTVLDRRMRRTSRSPSPLGHARTFSSGTPAAAAAAAAAAAGQASTPPAANGRTASRPLVVNGTGSSLRTSSTPSQRHSIAGITTDDAASDDPTRSWQDNSVQMHGLGISGLAVDQTDGQPAANADSAQTPVSERPPVIVNGTTASPYVASTAPSPSTASAPRAVDDPSSSFRDRIMNQYGWVQPVQMAPEAVGSSQPSLRQRAIRQQSGVIAPLDLATRENRMNGHQLSIEAQHLSPINETRSPSPTVVRKGDYPLRGDQSGSAAQNAAPNAQTEPLVPGSKLAEHKVLPSKESRPVQATTQSPKSQSTAAHRPNQSGSQPQSNAGQASARADRVNGIRENGHSRVKSDSHNSEGGWQKAMKGRKKGDAKNQGNGFIPSEQPPKHEADRKGG